MACARENFTFTFTFLHVGRLQRSSHAVALELLPIGCVEIIMDLEGPAND